MITCTEEIGSLKQMGKGTGNDGTLLKPRPFKGWCLPQHSVSMRAISYRPVLKQLSTSERGGQCWRWGWGGKKKQKQSNLKRQGQALWFFPFNYLPDKKEKIVIVSLHPQHFSLPRSTGREICWKVIRAPGLEQILPLAPRHLRREGQKGLQAEYMHCGSRVAVWLSTLLPVATASRLSPVCPHPEASPTHHRQEEDGAGEGRDRWRAGPGSTQQTRQKASVSCLYCTASLRAPALSSGHKASALKSKHRTCCCVPGSRRGGVLLCGLF